MFDRRLRRWIDPPLDAAGRMLGARGIGADHVTVAGFALGMAAATAIASGATWLGLVLVIANRAADGLDGAVARATAPTDRGGFLDITLDFAFYAAIPLAFAVLDSDRNALAAAFLIASFLINGSAFLAFAIIAAKRGLTTNVQGLKAIFYLAGIAEGAETIAVFCGFCVFPQLFPWLASVFAGICLVSGIARLVLSWRAFA
ncbi:MAG: CDP-alcohol phosphatidyltransferase family protein [Proteobacteria bacterium]|nr:CDP-alcohol phosphatidyltransferase family protein [Pseudomonadota bacterium]